MRTSHEADGCRSRHCQSRLAAVGDDVVRAIRGQPSVSPITVCILTFCRKPDLFYGTSLVFHTLRVGFPSARVVVVDNASLPELRPAIASLAREHGCAFVQVYEPAIEHAEFLEHALAAVARSEQGSGPLVFLDPDVCFWADCERFEFDALMAGKLYPAFSAARTDSIYLPRLHTSFLWIPSAERLWRAIERVKTSHPDFVPFQSSTIRLAGRWYRYDTAAGLYAALGTSMARFSEDHLACYDHIFSGTHLDWVTPVLDADTRALLETAHEQARQGNLGALKGVGALQDRLWHNHLHHRGGSCDEC